MWNSRSSGGLTVRESRLDPSASPLKAFGAQLRRLRKAAGLTQTQLGERTQLSDSQISNLERGTRNPTLEWVRAADKVLVTGGTLELTYWSLRGSSFLPGYPEYAAKEREARVIRLFELGIIPGLVQTRGYAEALEAGAVARGSVTAEQGAERVRLLLNRQERINRDPAPLIHVILDESCLRTVVGGGGAVMSQQLAHLEMLAQRSNYVVQVAPFELGALRPFMRSMSILDLGDGASLGYTETHQRGYLENDRAIVSAWAREYDLLQVEALSQTASLAKISKARRDSSA
ncbi:helix-turn-helix transcriptional regulator [Kitasatospora aureofaciens]|uniref:helix-turn-helix domain-containing protein n=1 Tax=Kitasatospora aureofaciens TaxID=1894 RepID=UPI0033FFA330